MGAVDQSGQMVSLTSNNSVPWLRKRGSDFQGRLQSIKGSWEPLIFYLTSRLIFAIVYMWLGEKGKL